MIFDEGSKYAGARRNGSHLGLLEMTLIINGVIAKTIKE